MAHHEGQKLKIADLSKFLKSSEEQVDILRILKSRSNITDGIVLKCVAISLCCAHVANKSKRDKNKLLDIGIIGCGLIGKRLVNALLDQGFKKSQLFVSTRRPSETSFGTGVEVTRENEEVVLPRNVRLLFICTLPMQLGAVCQSIRGKIRKRTLVCTPSTGYSAERLANTLGVDNVLLLGLSRETVAKMDFPPFPPSDPAFRCKIARAVLKSVVLDEFLWETGKPPPEGMAKVIQAIGQMGIRAGTDAAVVYKFVARKLLRKETASVLLWRYPPAVTSEAWIKEDPISASEGEEEEAEKPAWAAEYWKKSPVLSPTSTMLRGTSMFSLSEEESSRLERLLSAENISAELRAMLPPLFDAPVPSPPRILPKPPIPEGEDAPAEAVSDGANKKTG